MCKKKNSLFVVSLLFIFVMFSFVSSAVPIQLSVNQDVGIDIEYPHYDVVKVNSSFLLYTHAFNKSNGLILTGTTTDCNLHLYGSLGDRIYNEDFNESGREFNLTVGADVLTKLGIHTYIIHCNATDIGGFASGNFMVTEGGVEITEARSNMINGLMMVLVLLFFISLFCLFKIENYIGKFVSYWVSHILIILISFVAWQIGVEGLLGGVALTGIFRIMFWIFTIAVFPMIILSISWIVYIHVYNEHFQNLVEKGMDTENAFRIAKKKSNNGWLGGQSGR
jgi:hypothetical protein